MATHSKSNTGSRYSRSNLEHQEGITLPWHLISPLGPAVAHHAGAIIGNTLYIHGGINKKGSTAPLSGLHKLDLDNTIWQEVRTPGAPSLSHHACVVMEDRFLVFIGGWNGRNRSSDVHIYDTQEDIWRHPQSSGFPEGAGLSSHTATLQTNGNILIVGRDGSLRMQRRQGNCYILSGDVHKGQFQYSFSPLHVASRSGHTSHMMANHLYIIGGRDDKLIERHDGYNGMTSSCPLVNKIKMLATDLKPMTKLPGGRKQHVSLCGSGALFIHGGETFDGKNREPVGEMYLFVFKPNTAWYKLGHTSFGRAGHLCCYSGEKVIIHGGEGAKGVIYGDLYILEL